MQIIAHRGSMARGKQNTPAGVAVALHHGCDFLELDIWCAPSGPFQCSHGRSRPSLLADCLAAINPPMGLVAHLKGSFADADLLLLGAQLDAHLEPERVIYASHRSGVLRRVKVLRPAARLARFGLFPAILALVIPRPWDTCMVNQSCLMACHVRGLHARGYSVVASCVWELRSRDTVERLGVDAAFVNLA